MAYLQIGKGQTRELDTFQVYTFSKMFKFYSTFFTLNISTNFFHPIKGQAQGPPKYASGIKWRSCLHTSTGYFLNNAHVIWKKRFTVPPKAVTRSFAPSFPSLPSPLYLIPSRSTSIFLSLPSFSHSFPSSEVWGALSPGRSLSRKRILTHIRLSSHDEIFPNISWRFEFANFP